MKHVGATWRVLISLDAPKVGVFPDSTGTVHSHPHPSHERMDHSEDYYGWHHARPPTVTPIKATAGLGTLALSDGVWADPQRCLSVQ
jgi:hypothetical protein